MGHREHDLLGAREKRVERGREPLRCVGPALPAAGADRVRLVRPCPGAVVGERTALERAEADLVETREDDARHVAPAEREVERLLRPCEACRDAEVDRLVRERLPQRERLRDAELRQAFAGREGADAIVGVRAGVRVASEKQRSQNSTLRYARTWRMPTAS